MYCNHQNEAADRQVNIGFFHAFYLFPYLVCTIHVATHYD